MDLIGHSEFLKNYPEGQSAIFVGSAPSLKGEGLGEWIDGHDIVVRFNGSPVIGHEYDVGTKTTLVVTNPYPDKRVPLNFNGEVILITPQTRRRPSEDLEEWLMGYSVLSTFTPDLVMVGDVDHTLGLTTGVYGIHLLARLLRPSAISITGFTLFLADTDSHYWSSTAPSGVARGMICSQRPPSSLNYVTNSSAL